MHPVEVADVNLKNVLIQNNSYKSEWYLLTIE